MDEATATARLETMVAWQSDPALTRAELAELVTIGQRPDRGGNLPTNVTTAPTWTAATAYYAGDVIKTGTTQPRFWRCIVAGVSGATEPAWPDLRLSGPTCVTLLDGYAQWEDVGGLWRPTYDLAAAAAAGWEWKAAKCADRFQFTTDGQTFDRARVHAQCLEMADRYRNRAVTSTSTS